MITASHNPAEYNGMKNIQRDARPVSDDSGLREIAAMVGDEAWYLARSKQKKTHRSAVCTRIGD